MLITIETLQNLEMQMFICKEFEMKLHLKFIENCTERKFLTPMKKFLHEQRDPKDLEGGRVKKNLQVAIFRRISSTSVFPKCHLMEN